MPWHALFLYPFIPSLVTVSKEEGRNRQKKGYKKDERERERQIRCSKKNNNYYL